MKSKQVWWLFFARYPGLTTLLSLFWLIALAFIAFIWHLGDTGLVDETEPLFAEAARQMTVTGDWLTPYYNDATRFDKPPLIYWLMAIAYQVIGVNEWAVRLPSAIAAIALMSFTFITLRHFGFATPASAKAYYRLSNQVSVAQLWLSACLGAGFFALNMQVLIWARTGVSDMLLSPQDHRRPSRQQEYHH
ncbi:MAG: hypothetical protein D6756_06455 [Cyanobacteria bacterium J083]|nr:MAG: hypothetical protein D6756_06455 [Cyanobacteria bacterium J083]